jgi:very-short-patch-repair endonuclease
VPSTSIRVTPAPVGSTFTAIFAVNVDREGSAMLPIDVDGIARGQHGVVTRGQLSRLMGDDEIDNAVKSKRLFVIYRGVYAVGSNRLDDRGRVRAATFAMGPHSAGSFTTATALSKLTPTLPAVLHVSLTRGDRRNRHDVRVHRGLEPGDVAHIAGIPVTTTLRTLEDLNWPRSLVREALARSLILPEQLPFERPGDSDFEERFRDLTRRAGLPQPEAQYRLGPYRLDFAWPELRVAVETDGWATHGRRPAFEDDRARDAELLARGWRVLRVTYRRLMRRPMVVAAQLAAVLAQATAASASNNSVYSWPVASATGA